MKFCWSTVFPMQISTIIVNNNVLTIYVSLILTLCFDFISSTNVMSLATFYPYPNSRNINNAVQEISMFLFELITTIIRCKCLYDVSLFFPAGKQLHNIDVKVGKTKDSMRMCGHYSASARPGGQIGIWCPYGTVGRYVQVQIVRGEASHLSVAEVIVWGKRK